MSFHISECMDWFSGDCWFLPLIYLWLIGASILLVNFPFIQTFLSTVPVFVYWILLGVFVVLWEWIFIDDCIANTNGNYSANSSLLDYVSMKMVILVGMIFVLPLILFAGGVLVGIGFLIYYLALAVYIALTVYYITVAIILGIVGIIVGFFVLNGHIGKTLREKELREKELREHPEVVTEIYGGESA